MFLRLEDAQLNGVDPFFRQSGQLNSPCASSFLDNVTVVEQFDQLEHIIFSIVCQTVHGICIVFASLVASFERNINSSTNSDTKAGREKQTCRQ